MTAPKPGDVITTREEWNALLVGTEYGTDGYDVQIDALRDALGRSS